MTSKLPDALRPRFLMLFRAARAFEGLTAGASWRGDEPAHLGEADNPAGPTPAERAVALAVH